MPEDLRLNARIGNEAGWLLQFARERGPASADGYPSIGSDRFYADIKASLPAGLEGGTYSFVIEGLPDDLYERIRSGTDTSPNVIRLFLFWHEVLRGVTGQLRNLAGLTGSSSSIRAEDIPGGPVAVLSILKVTRKAGSRHYETTITAREGIFNTLAKMALCGRGIEADTPEAGLSRLEERLPALRGLLKFRGLDASPERPPSPQAEEGDAKVRLESGQMASALLEVLAKSMEERTNRHGRGMLLIRDNVVHIGTRPIPLDGASPVPLSLATGLVEVQAQESVVIDPSFDWCIKQNDQKDPPARRQFRLTLKGRPDLKPGDVVTFAAPRTESKSTTSAFGVLGDLADLGSGPFLPSLGGDDKSNDVKLYVHGVEHLLSRTAGFTSTVTGVELVAGVDPWDAHTPARPALTPEQITTDPVSDAARAVRGLVRRAVEVRRQADVGEVRSVTATGESEPPGQTELVWRGLAPPDGRGHQARRLSIDRDAPSPIDGVAYATPFAWGPCGLVLPRYPGTRVLLVHRDGRGDDPVDVGALWASGKRPEANPGDWWLVLPAEVAETDRAGIADSETPKEYTGKATNDLIDAEGNRCLEVGRLIVRIGADGLKAAGERPSTEGADLSIEHADGTTHIVVKGDGTIEIKAAKRLSLIVEDGPIELNTNAVNVKVADAMNVTGR